MTLSPYRLFHIAHTFSHPELTRPECLLVSESHRSWPRFPTPRLEEAPRECHAPGATNRPSTGMVPTWISLESNPHILINPPPDLDPNMATDDEGHTALH